MNRNRLAYTAIAIIAAGSTTCIAGEMYSGKSGKYSYEPSKAVIDNAPYTVDVYAGASVLYNSNTTQLFNGTGSWMGVFDYGFDFETTGSQLLFGFGYDGGAYWYENSAAQAGRDTLEHRVDGFIAYDSGKTSSRLSVDYYRNNGNALDFANLSREARSAQSHDVSTRLYTAHRLDHGSFEWGGGWILRDFDSGTNLNDQNSYYGDVAWFYNPAFAPKTSVGFGFRAGEDDFTNNVSQDFYTPSLRWRYRASAKTSAFGSFAYENRSGGSGIDTENFLFDVGLNWAATEKTNFNFYFQRAIRPSFSNTFQDFTSNGFILSFSHDLPGQFVLTGDVGYENADYFLSDPRGIQANVREDDYFRAGVAISHPCRLSQNLQGSITAFYNYNENDSTLNQSNFDQYITGLRFGLVY